MTTQASLCKFVEQLGPRPCFKQWPHDMLGNATRFDRKEYFCAHSVLLSLMLPPRSKAPHPISGGTSMHEQTYFQQLLEIELMRL